MLGFCKIVNILFMYKTPVIVTNYCERTFQATFWTDIVTIIGVKNLFYISYKVIGMGSISVLTEDIYAT